MAKARKVEVIGASQAPTRTATGLSSRRIIVRLPAAQLFIVRSLPAAVPNFTGHCQDP